MIIKRNKDHNKNIGYCKIGLAKKTSRTSGNLHY